MFIFEPQDFEFVHMPFGGSTILINGMYSQILRDFVVQFPIVLFIEVCKRDKYF